MMWFWSAFQQIPSDLGIRPLSLLLPCIAASNKYDWSLPQKGEKNSPNSYIDVLTALLPFKSYVPSVFCPIYPSSLPSSLPLSLTPDESGKAGTTVSLIMTKVIWGCD